MKLNSTILIVCTATFMVAALMPITAAVEAPSTQEVMADLQGCTRADANGNALVIGGPGAGFGLNWINPCVIIPNGGTVTWQQADGIPHGAEADDLCFSLGRMSVAGGTPAAADPSSQSITLDFDGLVAFGELDPSGFAECGNLELAGNTATLHYHCIVHGARMPGQIVIEL